MDKIDGAVVGAGVIGLAVARELARKGRTVVVIERHPSCGMETSSRNSEVIHAQAQANDCTEVSWIDGKNARALEPSLTCVAALVSPHTGIIDTHAYLLAHESLIWSNQNRRISVTPIELA